MLADHSFWKLFRTTRYYLFFSIAQLVLSLLLLALLPLGFK